jgi:hypothetical protein
MANMEDWNFNKILFRTTKNCHHIPGVGAGWWVVGNFMSTVAARVTR